MTDEERQWLIQELIDEGFSWSREAAAAQLRADGERIKALEGSIKEAVEYAERGERHSAEGYCSSISDMLRGALESPEEALVKTRGIKLSAVDSSDLECPICAGSGWVCENHPHHPAHDCPLCDGAGDPCRCNGLHAVSTARARADAQGWRPIESAPHDVRVITIDRLGHVRDGTWYANPFGNQNTFIDNLSGRWWTATHWMPLPKPPEESK